MFQFHFRFGWYQCEEIETVAIANSRCCESKVFLGRIRMRSNFDRYGKIRGVIQLQLETPLSLIGQTHIQERTLRT
jgi:hypothetical protein